jgi:HK97 family phage prohead protease
MPQVIERRAFVSDLEVRETPTSYAVRGYAARFDSPSHGEVVRSTAFNKTLAERDDVRLLANHDGIALARTKSGTLELGVDGGGLWYDAPSLDRDNPTVQEVVSALRRRDVDQSSFAFVDKTPHEERFDDDNVRNIREVKLYDVSIVTFPWYEDATAEVNALDDAFVAIRNGAPLTKEQRDLFVKLVIFDDDDNDLTEDLADVGETEPVPADDTMSMASADLHAIKAQIRRRRAA